MAAPEKGPKLGLLIGLGAKPKADEEAESDDGMEAKHMAAKALRAALKDDDDAALYDAFAEMVRHCDDDDMMGGGEEGETETEED